MIQALWFITLKQWRSHKLRVALTTLGIALGVAVFFAVRTTNSTLLDSLRLTIEKLAGKATLQVTAGESGFPEQVLDTVRATPGVAIAEPVIEVVAHTNFEDQGNLLVLGVDTASDQKLRDYEFDRSQTQVADPLVFVAQPFSILVSSAFAAKHDLKVGDKLPLFTSRGRKDFTVQGTFKPVGIGQVFGGNIAVIDVYSAQFIFDRGHNFDRIDVMTAPEVLVDTVQQRLREQLPVGVDVSRPEARGKDLENTVAAMREGMLVTSFVALLVGLYIIFNSFTINVNQRWKEIGILRAVGLERRNVTLMFLGEALLMGVLGSLVGILAGYYLAEAAGKLMGTAVASVYGLVSTPGASNFRVDFALLSISMGILASLAGAWFPARAGSRLDPALALHNIETRRRESVLGWKRITIGVLLVVGSLSLIRWSPARAGMTFQFLYAGVMIVGLAVLLPKLVEWSARALRPPMNWLGGSEGALAVDAMIQSPRRSSATVGALMIGLMFVFSTGAFIQSYQRVIDRWMKRMLNADIIVATSQLLRSPTYHFSEDLGVQIGNIPGVKRAENVRFTTTPYEHENVSITAYQMSDFMDRAGYAVDEGSEKVAREKMPKGEGFLISRNFSSRFNIGVGSILRLETPTGPLDRPILGIMDDYRSEKGTIFMDRSLYKTYWKDDSVDFIDVLVNPGVDPAAVKLAIERLTANQERAFVYTNAEFKGWVFGLVNQFFMLNYIQLIVAILVATLGIVNTLIISVSERQREIGIIRAIGGLRSQIRKMVLLEAVAISIVGLLAGAVASLFNTYFMVHTVAMVLAGYTVPFFFPWGMIALTLPIVVVISLAAAWWPARRAVQTRVIEAIAYE
jgi:putative ABC transport system permease protein